MSNISSGTLRFQDNLSSVPLSQSRSESRSGSSKLVYHASPTHSHTTSLLSSQENGSPSSPSFLSPTSASTLRQSPSRSRIASNDQSNDYRGNQQSSLSATPSNGSTRLRPQRSLVMKHRLRHLQYDDYDEQQQQLPVSKPLPELPQGGTGVGEGAGGPPRRRGASSYRKGFRRSMRSKANSDDDLDRSGLLDHIADTGVDADAAARAGPEGKQELIEMQTTRMSTDLDDIDLEGNKVHHHGQGGYHGEPGFKEGQGHHHHTLDKMIHGHRPDRHLFPYRTSKENVHAMKTFFRRFFLVLLIIPGWIVPIVMTAKMEHEEELKEENMGNHHKRGGGEEHAMLSKEVNLAIFLLNMFAMMHLGKAAGACMEELVPKLGMGIVSILDAMTSSSVELAVAAFALMKGLVRVVQAAMLGAILNNLLLMMGITFVVGGYYHNDQPIQADTSQTGMNLLMIVCISYVIPVALDATFIDLRTNALDLRKLEKKELFEKIQEIRELVDLDILTISKVMAILMLIIYGCCLLFQYSSRHFMVTPEAKHTDTHTVHRRNVHYWFAGFGYFVMLGAQIYSANLLVHAVEALGKQFSLNDSFVGFVLLPIVLVSDLQEEVIAIRESKLNRLDRSIALMIGSCMQISLLVTPLLVLLGWIIDEQMTFRFSLMEVVILAGSVMIVNYLIQDKQTNWLEGCLLLAAFFMCAIAFYYDMTSFGHGESGGGEGAGHGSGGEGGGGPTGGH
ncbi:hypothetical protein BGZ50_006087 [Haplosporangium sp. Z 11]|nr:hypothetical protein BGZ50_006087 [Haplosporangium sp. Z 11]